jgi:hypothetical protein
MPKIRWKNLPPSLRAHLFERLRERKISAEDLYERKSRRPGLWLLQDLWRGGVSEDLPASWPAGPRPEALAGVEAEPNEGSMSRKKRSLFRELLAGIRAMCDHAEGKVELRTSLVTTSPATLEEASTRRTARRARHRRWRPSLSRGHTRSASTKA